AVLGCEGTNVCDFVAYWPGERDSALGIHFAQSFHQSVVAPALEGVDQGLLVRGGGVGVDRDLNAEQLSRRRVLSPGTSCESLAFGFFLGVRAPSGQQQKARG